MKKILIFLTFIILFFFFSLPTDNVNKEELKLNKEKNKITKETTPTIIENNTPPSTKKEEAKKIIKTPIKKEEVKINLNPEITISREKDRYKKEKYKEPKSIKEVQEEKIKEDLEMNFGISIDKEKKAIDSIKLDLQKKF
jgi:uncharacterized membrane protein YhiD involved in acid resistance